MTSLCETTIGLSNTAVQRWGSKFVTGFCGVISYENLGNIRDGKWIINFGAGARVVGHFFALIKSGKRLTLFDPLNAGFRKIINYSYPEFEIRDYSCMIQDIHSVFCGHYCLAFLFSVSVGLKPVSFLNYFARNKLAENDKIVCFFLQYVEHLFT